MGKESGESQSLQDAQTTLANQMAATGRQSAQEGSTLFNLALPGLERTETYYSKLASGDPTALSRANAPAIQQIGKQSDSAKKNIISDNPRGGERNLALEEADITKGAQVSGLTTGSYTGSFGSLAGLGGQNVSQGNAATATGLQGMNAAGNQYGQLQQLNNEQKATQLGFFSSLAGSASSGAGMAVGLCALAIAYWGETDQRTLLVRRWLTKRLFATWWGRIVAAAYIKHGPYLAKCFHHKRLVHKLAVPLFDRLLVLARKEA